MKILGISAFYHDSAASIIENGEILAAAQEERFTRNKHDPGFPHNAITYCLDHAGRSIDDLDAVVFYDKPLLKFERLLETYYAFAPKGLPSFIASMPVWLREKMFLKRVIREELGEIGEYNKKKLKLLFPEHHLSHAASAFYPSPFEEAAILTLDGVGEWATASIAFGHGNTIRIIKELHFPHSAGLLYSAFTYFLGFRVNSGEYKLMGLAPYGNPYSEEFARFKQLIEEHLVTLFDDGSIWLNQEYFNYATGLRMIHEAKWKRLFGFERRLSEAPIEARHCNLALAIQRITEEIVLRMAGEARKLTGAKALCMAGGVALNCVANGKLEASGMFDYIFIQPAAGDAGGALGAALAAHHIHFDQERVVHQSGDRMHGAYLGPRYAETDVETVCKRYSAVAEKFEGTQALIDVVAREIANGAVAGWMQGRMEFGPRALGARSILADARNEEMQKKLNLKIKFRESFRPFAPSILVEDIGAYFDNDADTPYMLMVRELKKECIAPIPEDYHERDLRDRLYVRRSDLPAVTHVDFTARIQSVHQSTNPAYYRLIQRFKALTGYGILVNTSFNVRGEPIVCTPEDAYRCFMRTGMDILVIENYLFRKSDQPAWDKDDKWSEDFILD